MAKVIDSLMVAEPKRYRLPRAQSRGKAAFRTVWLTADDFYRHEKLAKRYDEILWHSFHTHGKYARIVRQAQYFAVATDSRGHYVSSAFIVPSGAKWLLEYMMTDPKHQGQGAASAVLDRIMREAKKAKVQWVILNCDPQKNNGQLPALYGKFGFKKVN